MKVLVCVMMLALSLFSLTVNSQQLTVNQVKEIQERVQLGEFDGRAQWNALTYYLQGVIEGAAGYQAGLTNVEKPHLFCPPKGKQYSLDEFLTILDQSSSDDKNRPASLVLIETYTHRYPCT